MYPESHSIGTRVSTDANRFLQAVNAVGVNVGQCTHMIDLLEAADRLLMEEPVESMDEVVSELTEGQLIEFYESQNGNDSFCLTALGRKYLDSMIDGRFF
jgi:hypothetical protein